MELNIENATEYVKEPCLTPKVSIIVPVFNSEKYLEKCFLSLVNQTLKEIEIIFVNDGSIDKSPEILEEFKSLDARIVVLHQENKKQGAARNYGFSVAKGEYIGYVDSDDWIDNDYYEKLYNAAKNFDSDIALGTNIRVGNGKTKKRVNINKEEFVTALIDKFKISNQAKNPCPTNKIYRKTMLENNNIIWPDGCFNEDKLYTLQAVYYANGLVTVPEANYYYYRNPVSTVNSKEKSHIKKINDDKIAAHNAVLKFLKEKKALECDRMFWGIKKEIKFCGVVIYRVLESLLTEEIRLFGIKIIERKLSYENT